MMIVHSPIDFSPFFSRIVVVVVIVQLHQYGFVVAIEEKVWKDVCTQDSTRDLPFCDVSLSLNDRVNDYVGRFTSVEDQAKMLKANYASGYDPLDIPGYQWWSEGLHGPLEPCVTDGRRCACPTSFPCPSALGTSFNKSLFELVGMTVGREGLAISKLRNHSLENGDGIDYWSPTINMQRDPRWGRNQEVPGEDPFLTSVYATSFVRGIQQQEINDNNNSNDDNDDGNNNNRVKIGACCKHFVANSLENWKNYTRFNFDAVISISDLENYYFPAFKACTKEAVGVMCSYNSLNGEPACANQWLLRTKLRDEWGFDGYITSDCGAIRYIEHSHHFVNTSALAAAVALNATTDLNCGDGHYYPTALIEAYHQGIVEAETIKESFKRTVAVQMRLGLFDNNVSSSNNNKKKIIRGRSSEKEAAINIIDSREHQKLALEAAQQSIVLLKNEDNTLPLKPITRFKKTTMTTNTDSKEGPMMSLALIGPHVYGKQIFLSNYHGDRCCCSRRNNNNKEKKFPQNLNNNYDCMKTPLETLTVSNVWGPTAAIQGCNVDGTDLNDIDKAVALASNSTTIVLVMGLDQAQEREGLDRMETTLPGLQMDLIKAILNLKNPRTVLVLLNGGALSLGEDILRRCPAIVDAFYGGQAASQALADVLFGGYNPTGKLAATMYPPSYVHTMPMNDMGLSSGFGRTHMYYKGRPEFAFGHGLSYSQWDLVWQKEEEEEEEEDYYSQLELTNIDERVTPSSSSSVLHCDLEIRNLGPMASHQTILLFWRIPQQQRRGNNSDNDSDNKNGPYQKLIGFVGIDFLPIGKKQVVTFEIKWNDFALWNDRADSATVSTGTYELIAVTANGIKAQRNIHLKINNDDNAIDHHNYHPKNLDSLVA